MTSTEASLATFERHTYEDPFLDMASTRLPKSYRKLQELCQIFAMTHPQIAPIVWRLAEYPITSIVYTGDKEACRQTKNTLENEVGVLDRAIEMGLDYFAYGNAFGTVQFPFTRYYQCQRCKGQWPAKQMRGRRFDGREFTASCKQCATVEKFDAIDQYLRRAKGIKFVRLEPMLMTLKYNAVTGHTFYFYDIPMAMKSAIQKSDWDIIDSTPVSFIKCVINNTKLKVNRVFHFKRPTLSGRDMQWGLPLIMPCLKDAYLNQIYKKADEQIALEHSVPLRILFPEPGTQDPLAKIAMGSFRGFLEQNIRRWRTDKNAILTAPLPVGAKVIGGDHSAYQTIQARQFVVDEIIGACMVTKGFVMGGEQWSAASITQRQLENSFLNYLRRLDQWLQWSTDEVSSFLRAPKCSVAMKPFKKVDDIQMLQLVLQMAREKKVSWNEVLSRMDLDSDEQIDQIEREAQKYIKIMIEELIGQAEAGAKGSVIQAAAQSESEGVQAVLAEQLQKAQMAPGGAQAAKQVGPAGDAGGAGAGAGGAKVTPATQGNGTEAGATGKPGVGGVSGKGGDFPSPDQPAMGKVPMGAQVESAAQELLTMQPEQMRGILARMAKEMPEFGQAVASRASELQASGGIDISKIIAAAGSPEDIAKKLMMADPQPRLKALRAIQQKNPVLGLSVMKAMAQLNASAAGMAPGNDVVDMRAASEQNPMRRQEKMV